MKTIDSHTSAAIAKFSFFATLLVVMCHADDIMCSGQVPFLVRFLGGSFSDANVYNFFFLSGFLLARHYGESNWWTDSLKKRVRTLLVPYAMWCVLYYVLVNASDFMCMQSTFDIAAGVGELKGIFGLGLFTKPYNWVLWYVKSLFYFILLSPILFPALKKSSIKYLCSATVVMFVLRAVAYRYKLEAIHYLSFNTHLLALAVFMWGSWCSLHDIRFPAILEKTQFIIPLVIWTVVAVSFFLIDNMTQDIGYIMAPINIAVSCFCLMWVCFCLEKKIPAMISKCSFFIYASHIMVLRAIKSLWPTCASLFAYSVLVVATVAVSVGIAHTVYLVSPRFAELLSGGRFCKSNLSIERK